MQKCKMQKYKMQKCKMQKYKIIKVFVYFK